MNDAERDEACAQLVRSTLPPMTVARPSRDLWPVVAARMQAPPRWTWFDVSLAAAAALALLIVPEWLWLLAYHL